MAFALVVGGASTTAFAGAGDPAPDPTAGSAPDPAPLSAPATELPFDAEAVSVEVAVARILAETNAARQAESLAPLSLNPAISKVAQAWSQQQYEAGQMSHNPSYAQQIPPGWSGAAENVAWGYSYDTVTTGWLNSPGHRANILNPRYTDIGIGYYEKNGQRYFTQNFAAYQRVPGAVGNLTVSAVTVSTATVTWSPPGGEVTRYAVTYTADGGSAIAVETAGTSVNLTGLSVGRGYTVRVEARNSIGTGASASVRFATPAEALPPAAPAVPVVSAVTDTGFSATWPVPDGRGASVTSYDVEVTGPGAPPIARVTKPTFAATGLTPGATYGVRVRAANSAGVSEWSARAAVTLPTATVERIGGADRYDVSAAVSAATFAPDVPVAFVASGEVFPDALSGSAAAGAEGGPVLLVTKDGVPTAVGAELDRLNPGRIVVLGGPASVSSRVQSALGRYASEVSRLQGADRFDVSAAISAATFDPGVPVVYVASGLVFPDALSGSAAAGVSGAPVLLVTGERIPASVQKELKRLDPDRIVVLGGPATVGESVLGQLRRVAETARIGGADRYAVSAAVAERAFPETGGTVYVSSGQKFPDALSGSAAAIRSGSPVLLVTDSVLPTDVAAQLARLKPERVVILGGESSVSEAVARAVQSATAG